MKFKGKKLCAAAILSTVMVTSVIAPGVTFASETEGTEEQQEQQEQITYTMPTIVDDTLELERGKSAYIKDLVEITGLEDGYAIEWEITSNEGEIIELVNEYDGWVINPMNVGDAVISGYLYKPDDATFEKMLLPQTLKIHVYSAPYIEIDEKAVCVGGSYTIEVYGGNEGRFSEVVWTSADENIATIERNSDGTYSVVGRSVGKTVITGTSNRYADEDSEPITLDFDLYVTDVSLESDSIIVSTLGDEDHAIKLVGDLAPCSVLKCTSTKKSVVKVYAENDGFYFVPKSKGDAKLVLKVDGKKLVYKVHVSDPYVKTNTVMMNGDYAIQLAKGQSSKIKLKGLNSLSTVAYESRNTSVATVSDKGVVKAKKTGKATIVIEVDDAKVVCVVEVAKKAAIQARDRAYKIMFSSSYSQLKRMSNGYYDCSSLVFRGYNKSTKLLGGSKYWAPTAAAEAYYLNKNGKVISKKACDTSKLLPGDLIFYGGAKNGRYKGIYHVSMYYGGGIRLERDLKEGKYGPRYYYGTDDKGILISRPIK